MPQYIIKMTLAILLAALLALSFSERSYAQLGYAPRTTLLYGSDGNLYGVTSSGGVNGQGAIFQESPSGGTPTLLYSFDEPLDSAMYSGLQPLDVSRLIQANDGNLYGTIANNSRLVDRVFKITTGGVLFLLVFILRCQCILPAWRSNSSEQ